jgi:hypothetical protein
VVSPLDVKLLLDFLVARETLCAADLLAHLMTVCTFVDAFEIHVCPGQLPGRKLRNRGPWKAQNCNDKDQVPQ